MDIAKKTTIKCMLIPLLWQNKPLLVVETYKRRLEIYIIILQIRISKSIDHILNIFHKFAYTTIVVHCTYKPMLNANVF